MSAKRAPRAKVEAAVETMRRYLYLLCDVNARQGDVKRLQARANRQVDGLARTISASPQVVWIAVEREANRRGKVCPLPGKDI